MLGNCFVSQTESHQGLTIFHRNAKIAGLTKDLKFSKNGDDYAWLLTIFYISYIIFEWFALM